ncbi:polyprenyl synthetase family protein [Umezawaea endophytica]|uniref:Polyprenyl synthetase family protein n=1 Tax=Umezawaea endophytica TaxID=1654476 RepID=A0A9X2VQZ2_9PSEU|nr:polyprenyl synthetase family protein [Umezawaea endophytica]MCS7481225.1 polyprenyl synthetase family protein [Umezawaea endophytica]
MWSSAAGDVEWWTVHLHLVTGGGDELGLSVRFLRQGSGAGHAVLVDGVAWLDGGAMRSVREAVERDVDLDPWIREAFRELLAGGRPVEPDRVLPGVVRGLDFGVAVLEVESDGLVRLTTARGELVGVPVKPVGPDGCSRLVVRGTVDGRDVDGTGWLAHDDGPLKVHLDNGWDVAVDLACSPEGEPVPCRVGLVGSEPWTSLSTLHTYPTRWRMVSSELELVLSGDFPRHEFRTMVGRGPHLHGWARVSGTMAGRPVTGKAFLDVVPDNRVGRFEDFLGRLRAITHAEVRALYPDSPSAESTADLAGADAAGLPHAVVHDALVRPVRHVVDAGGRGWRTFATCAATEMFGVSSDPYTPLLGVVELVHSGNLVVDDVEDGSPLRRGVPAAHVVHGVAAAVNAGTAAYFALDRVVPRILPDDDRLRLRVYQTFLRAIRAGHVGQGVDIAGHRAAMDHAVATGDGRVLLDGVRGVLRFKTGMPARAFAEIGALIAGADDERVAAVGDYFEAVGLAYQITDDLMDLGGVTGPTASGGVRATKHVGEDLRAGKVTMPLAHAVGLLPPERLAAVWAVVRDGRADHAAVREIAEELVGCGAARACHEEARSHVDTAWAVLEPLLPNTFTKVVVRALGHYAALRERQSVPG